MRQNRIVPFGILIAYSFLALTGIFYRLEVFSLNVNQLIYLIPCLALFAFIFMRSHFFVSKNIIFPLAILSVFLCLHLFFSGFSFELHARFFLSLLPLIFARQFVNALSYPSNKAMYLLYKVYLFAIFLGLGAAFLQYSGFMSFRDFDYVDGMRVGRISGFYEKPVIFIITLLPLFYRITLYQRFIFRSLILIIFAVIIYHSGHRTSLLAFVFCVPIVLAPKYLYRFLKNNYVPALYLMCTISLVLGLELLNSIPGAYLLRGRLEMWLAHWSEVRDSLMFLTFGKGQQTLEHATQMSYTVYDVNEVHGDFVRVLKVYGIFGIILILNLLSRYQTILKLTYGPQKSLPLIYISGIFLLCFSLTNEPTYYPAIFWHLTVGVAFILEIARRKSAN